MQTEQTIALSTGVLIDAKNDLTGWTRTNLKEAVAITGASGDHRELHLGVLQQLLDPVLLRSDLGHQRSPVPGQVTEPPDRFRRHETGAQHLPFGDLAQPDRVQPVGLGASGQVLDVLGVDQPGLEPGASNR